MENRIERALDVEAKRNQFNAEENQRLGEAMQTKEAFVESHRLVADSEKRSLLKSGTILVYFNGYTNYTLSYDGKYYIITKDGVEIERNDWASSLQTRDLDSEWYC